LKDNYFTMQSTFNHLLNVAEDRNVIIPDSLSSPDISYSRQEILDSIKQANPQVMQLEFAEAAYRKQELAARKSGAPKIMLGAEYMVMGKSSNPMVDASESGKDAFVFPMVGITIPLYRKKYNSMVKEAALMQEVSVNQKIDKVNILESTFEKANRDYQDAKRRVPLFILQSDRAQKAMNILQTEYESDGKNFEEVLRMERQLLKYKLELEKARADKAAAIAFISYLMGK
jgi:outer membrane protein, heavy metal efflux system